jgi:hypothetical protein
MARKVKAAPAAAKQAAEEEEALKQAETLAEAADDGGKDGAEAADDGGKDGGKEGGQQEGDAEGKEGGKEGGQQQGGAKKGGRGKAIEVAAGTALAEKAQAADDGGKDGGKEGGQQEGGAKGKEGGKKRGSAGLSLNSPLSAAARYISSKRLRVIRKNLRKRVLEVDRQPSIQYCHMLDCVQSNLRWDLPPAPYFSSRKRTVRVVDLGRR